MKHVLRTAMLVFAGALFTTLSIPSMAGDTIKIGLVAPMSGDYGQYGEGFYNSMRSYMNIYGDKVAGKKVEIIVRDNSTNTPENAKRLAQELATRDKVDFLAGFALSNFALAVAPLSAQAKVPTIVMLGATSGLTARSPYLIRVSYTNYQTSATMAEWAHKNGIKRVYTVVSDFAPGIDAEKTFSTVFEGLGGKILGAQRIPLRNNDYAPYVRRLKDAGPQAVFLFVPSGAPMIAFMKNFSELGMGKAGVKLMSSTDLAPEFIDPLGDTAQYLINSIQYYDTLDNPENKKYVSAYLKLTGKIPGAIALGGYDGMALVYAVAKKLKGNLTPDTIMATVKGLSITSPRGPLSIDPNTRDSVANMYIAKVEKRNDHYVPVVIDTFENVTGSN